ncbi:hypothetical protein [Hoeflea poritis]|uniref:Secreted protein n=1 Tax=Hoeflea poritis TaxID=2993659 RepID=A0ABT4VTV2_9HYPH|nr:hypothetical protein [Hoeflea poritis]MDA4848143.1 hypothetical protein [Hoeflea poritis]
MRFIIKALFWFGVVVLFLPGNGEHDSATSAEQSTRSAVELRELAVRIQQICLRDPALCRNGAAELLASEEDEIARLLRSEAAQLAGTGD